MSSSNDQNDLNSKKLTSLLTPTADLYMREAGVQYREDLLAVRETSHFQQGQRNGELFKSLKEWQTGLDTREAELRKHEAKVAREKKEVAELQAKYEAALKKLQLDRAVLDGEKADLKIKREHFVAEIKKAGHIMGDAEMIEEGDGDLAGLPRGEKGLPIRLKRGGVKGWLLRAKEVAVGEGESEEFEIVRGPAEKGL